MNHLSTPTPVSAIDPTLANHAAQPAARDLEALYRDESEDTRRKSARQGLWTAVAVYLLFSFTDAILIPDVAAYAIAARLLIGVAVVVLFEIQFRNHVGAFWLDLTCAMAVAAGYVFWVLIALQTEYVSVFSYYIIFGNLFILGSNLFFTIEFLKALASSLSILFLSFIILFSLYDNYYYLLTISIFYISSFTFTAYVNWKLNRERYSVFLNALEARRLQRQATERGQTLYRLSRIDSLTGLDNRRSIDEKLLDYWREWVDEEQPFAVILIDIDHFKRFNDYYGHQKGDHCLTLVADALSGFARPHGALIGRYGGEEFIALMRIDDPEQVTAFSEEICDTVARMQLPHQGRQDKLSFVTASVGASFVRHGADKLEKIFSEADRALYTAKEAGRNRARIFNPDDPDTSDLRDNVAALLKTAARQESVSMVYQPIRRVGSDKIEAVEALMRLRMPDDSYVLPTFFISIAEQTGAIVDLGYLAIRTACRELQADGQFPDVSVNISPTQLKAPGFASEVKTILADTGVSGSRLIFEITEQREMEMQPEVLACISDLKQLGIRCWLDDFGTGFAGLSWLRLIDFETVKIDRSFLRDSDTASGRKLLRDIARLIENRGSQTLLEGVQDQEQAILAQKLGIKLVQGFYIGRPQPAGRFHGSIQ